MNPIPKAREGSRKEIDFDRTSEGEVSNRKLNPIGVTKSIKPINLNMITIQKQITIRFFA